MASKKLRPAAPRNYMVWGVVALLLSVGILLLYRYMSGTTVRDQRAITEAQKAAEALKNAPPPNPESFSAKLGQTLEETTKAKALDASRPGAASTSQESANPLNGSSLPPSPSPLPDPRGTRGLQAFGGPGWDASPDELDAYERQKAAAALAANPPRSEMWQAQGESANTARPAGLTQLMAVSTNGTAAADNQQGTNQGQGTNTSNTQQQFMQAYLRQLAAGTGSAGAQGSQPLSNSQQQFRQSLQGPADDDVLHVKPAKGRYLVMEGTSIPVVMEDDVSSDIQGRCRARVAQDVLDSTTLSVVLIPAGTRATCTYDSQVVQGQDKMLLAFTRMIFPDGRSVSLGVMEAADRYGATGAPATVNSRFWRIFGTSFLIATVTRLAEPKTASGATITINAGGSAGAATAASVLAETAKKVLERNLNIRPELRLHAGDYLRLTVTKDMLIDPYTKHPQLGTY